MTALRLFRWAGEDGRPRLGLSGDGAAAVDLTAAAGVRSIPELWEQYPGAGDAAEACARWWAELDHQPLPGAWLLPLDLDELWAAGVTYERSRDARNEETEVKESIYDWVYEAPRPELFFKAPAGRIAGPGEAVGLRRDATWHVPEPELTVVLGPDGRVFGYTAGNDMTARDLEAKNPLYLPQAKIFHRSAAIGPTVALAGTVDPYALTIRLVVRRHGAVAFEGATEVRRLRRSIEELVGYLGHEWPLAPWTGLMTGTGIVPPDWFALEDGDEIAISVDGIGTLTNVARRIDADWAAVGTPPPRLLRVDPRDTVVVALGRLEPGMRLQVGGGGEVVVRDPIPFGHKVALVAMKPGDPVIKYGEVIGVATRPIEPGQHAHVHNIDSNRGRGDLVARKEAQMG